MSLIKKKPNLVQLAVCAAALFLLAVLILVRADETGEENLPDTVRLWYIEDDYFTALLQRAREADILSGTGTALSIRSFETEQELADALDSERPEMLWCAGDTAEALSRNGSLKSISDYVSSLPESYGCFSGNGAFEAGEFYPLKLEAEILVYDADAFPEAGSFEAVLSGLDSSRSETTAPRFACSSWYALFEALVSGSGEVFGTSRLENAKNETFVSAYNSVAELALSGNLYSGELHPLEAFEKGECLFCAVSSNELEAAELSRGYGLCVPVSNGIVPAGAYGIAVTAEDFPSARACGPVIEALLSLASPDGVCFPVSCSTDAFPAGTGKIVIKGYVPGTEAAALSFDEEISRMLSILYE